MKAMILAAGVGSRLKPWTDNHPKALAVVNGKSLLQRNIEYLQRYQIDEVIVNVHHFSEQIIAEIKASSGWGSVITVSDETQALLETGGGLKKAAWYFSGEENFVLMNADILTDMNMQDMIGQHQSKNPLATLAVSNRDTSRYFLFDEEQILSGWRNVKTGEEKIVRTTAAVQIQKAFSGIHVINTAIFSLMQQEGKFSMVEVYLSLAHDHTIRSFDHTGIPLVDVGKPDSIRMAESIFI